MAPRDPAAKEEALLHTFVEVVVRRAHALSDEHPTRGSLGTFYARSAEAIGRDGERAVIDLYFVEELAREARRSVVIARELEGLEDADRILRRGVLKDLRRAVKGKKKRARILAPLLAHLFDEDEDPKKWERRLRKAP